MSKATVNAMLARGFDSRTAKALAKHGYTLNKLKSLSLAKLKSLGLRDDLAQEVQKGGRPPIPTDTLHKLLYESKSICCHCREGQRPIILHHINPWHKSRSHDEANLVVLCLNCHDESHTTRQLSLNLTPARLRDHKARWIEEVRSDTLKVRLGTSGGPLSMPVWDYFNHKRIVDAAIAAKIKMSGVKFYSHLLDGDTISKSGALNIKLTAQELQHRYVYDVIDRRIQFYFQSLLEKVAKAFPLVDLSESWGRSTCNFLQPGTLALYAGGWRFKKQKRSGPKAGPGQMRTAYVRRSAIKLTFDFDAWEVTSSSSWGHLGGQWPCTAVCVVRSVERQGKELVINATGLGVGTGFTLPVRESRFSGYFFSPEDTGEE